MTKDEALAQLATSWSTLMAAIDGIPMERWDESGVTGDWSLKDDLGHVAFWDHFSATQAERRLAGDLTDAEPHDTDTVNAADREAKSGWSAADIHAELIAAHDALLVAYQALPTFEHVNIDEDWIHYDEHAAEIRSWREQQGI